MLTLPSLSEDVGTVFCRSAPAEVYGYACNLMCDTAHNAQTFTNKVIEVHAPFEERSCGGLVGVGGLEGVDGIDDGRACTGS